MCCPVLRSLAFTFLCELFTHPDLHDHIDDPLRMVLPPHNRVLGALAKCERSLWALKIQPPDVVDIVRGFLPKGCLVRIAFAHRPGRGVNVATRQQQFWKSAATFELIGIWNDLNLDRDSSPDSRRPRCYGSSTKSVRCYKTPMAHPYQEGILRIVPPIKYHGR